VIQELLPTPASKAQYAGLTALVTGASSGIGVETARALASLRMHVFMPVRDRERGRAVVAQLEQDDPAAKGLFTLLDLDMDSLASVRACAADFLVKSGGKLNLLINNAGIMATPEEKTKDGFEKQFGTNHLAHYLLTRLLLPALQASSTPTLASRVISVSSSAHAYSAIHFDDLDLKKRGYHRFIAYGQSKTANIYLAAEVDRRFGSLSNGRVRSLALHPGSITTTLQKHVAVDPFTDEEMASFGIPLSMRAAVADPKNPNRKTVSEGAATTIWAAIHPAFERDGASTTAKFLEDTVIAPPKVGTSVVTPGYAAWIGDEKAARRLWDISAEMVGVAKD